MAMLWARVLLLLRRLRIDDNVVLVGWAVVVLSQRRSVVGLSMLCRRGEL
jgi:hypothetical protein